VRCEQRFKLPSFPVSNSLKKSCDFWHSSDLRHAEAASDISEKASKTYKDVKAKASEAWENVKEATNTK